MSADDSAVERVGRVRDTIVLALSKWNSSDVTAMSECEAMLERSTDDLQRLHEVAAGSVLSNHIRLELLAIKASIEKFMRIVDASSAFVAGVGGLTADTGISYDSAGSTQRMSRVDQVFSEGETLCQIF